MFVCPLVMIGPEASGVNMDMLDVSVFEGYELVDLLSFREWF
jgi:hypothetical protein